MGERGPKALDLSAREMPFLVTRFAYLISASRLTVVRAALATGAVQKLDRNRNQTQCK